MSINQQLTKEAIKKLELRLEKLDEYMKDTEVLENLGKTYILRRIKDTKNEINRRKNFL